MKMAAHDLTHYYLNSSTKMARALFTRSDPRRATCGRGGRGGRGGRITHTHTHTHTLHMPTCLAALHGARRQLVFWAPWGTLASAGERPNGCLVLQIQKSKNLS